jgi:ATP-dependent DNA helicase DinG
MPTLPLNKVLALIDQGGLIQKKNPRFEARPQQKEMLKDVLEAYNTNSIALIEAGTGTGKSLAYLIPALLFASVHQEKTVISTKTITLQEQLIQKDIPNLIEALNLDLKVTLVKGMGNYLCLKKLEESRFEKHHLNLEERGELSQIEAWRETTVCGTKSSLPFHPSLTVWEKVSAEADVCQKKQCPFFESCFFFKARQEMEQSQILVVNHHLLFSDLSVRAQDGEGILPEFKRLIIDEAHHIEDIATQFFATHLNDIQLSRILGKLMSDKGGQNTGKLPLLKEKLYAYYKTKDLKTIDPLISRLSNDLPFEKNELRRSLKELFVAYQDLKDLFTTREDGDKLRLLLEHKKSPLWIERIIPQTEQLKREFNRFIKSLNGVLDEMSFLKEEKLLENLKGLIADIKSYGEKLKNMGSLFSLFISEEDKKDSVSWIESRGLIGETQLVEAPLNSAQKIANHLFKPLLTTVLSSATLTTNNNFDFIKKRLGIDPLFLGEKKVIERVLDSSFDYKKQALFLIPTDFPSPQDPSFIDHAKPLIFEAIQATQGATFVLFTSYGMLNQCYQSLKEALQKAGYTLLKQGDSSRTNLIKMFKKTPRSILFGTDSFWEGVDIAGDALKCVILVKLPFRPPKDPLQEARNELILEEGGNPFLEHMVPTAIVKFKQGFGRLIRTKTDRGCVICLDTRLLSKFYGKLFLDSLPNCEKLFIKKEEIAKRLFHFYRK